MPQSIKEMSLTSLKSLKLLQKKIEVFYPLKLTKIDLNPNLNVYEDAQSNIFKAIKMRVTQIFDQNRISSYQNSLKWETLLERVEQRICKL